MIHCLAPHSEVKPSEVPYKDELLALASQLSGLPDYWAREVVRRVERLWRNSTRADRGDYARLESLVRRICEE